MAVWGLLQGEGIRGLNGNGKNTIKIKFIEKFKKIVFSSPMRQFFAVVSEKFQLGCGNFLSVTSLITFSHLRYQPELFSYAVLRSRSTNTPKSPTAQASLRTSQLSKPFPTSQPEGISNGLCLMHLSLQVRKLVIAQDSYMHSSVLNFFIVLFSVTTYPPSSEQPSKRSASSMFDSLLARTVLSGLFLFYPGNQWFSYDLKQSSHYNCILKRLQCSILSASCSFFLSLCVACRVPHSVSVIRSLQRAALPKSRTSPRRCQF